MRILCPECDATLNIRNVAAGRTLECPKCGAEFLAPGEEPEEDDEAPRRKKKSKSRAAGKDMPVAKIVTTAVAAILAAVAIIWVISGPDKPDTQAKTEKKKDEDTAPPVFASQPNITAAAAPEDIAALFQQTGEKVAPTVPLPLLSPPAVPGGEDLLTLSAAPPPAKEPVGKGGDMTLEEIKKAVAFIRIDGPVPGSGSGFLVAADGTAGLVATNHHVVEMTLRPPAVADGPKFTITAVFDSGLSTETEHKAEVVGFDRDIDLAILRIPVARDKLPKPLEPKYAPAPRETTRVRICGFPFGEQLAKSSKRAPAISVGTGAVSSIRRDDADKIVSLQIDGAINPGNSGGPIVDESGKLVGIAVATYRGAGFGVAIPPTDLTELLEGYVRPPSFIPLDVENGEAAFEVVVPVADPQKRVASVALHAWHGEGDPPAGVKDAGGRWRAVPGATRFALPAATQGESRTTMKLKAPESGRPVVLQFEAKSPDGSALFSEPVTYTFTLGKAQSARDAMPLTAFHKNLAKYQGQTMVVRAKYVHPPDARWDVNVININGENDEPFNKLLFLTDRPMGIELSNLLPPGFGGIQLPPIPVRLTIVVGKTRSDGTTPIRVTRMDLIGRGDRLMITIPGGKLP